MVSTHDRNWTWTKSSRSKAIGECVEVGSDGGDTIGVRDSKQPDKGALFFDRSQWDAFLRTLPQNPT